MKEKIGFSSARGGRKCIPQGLKPTFLCAVDARPEGLAYLNPSQTSTKDKGIRQ
jgi:hypothetical protein